MGLHVQPANRFVIPLFSDSSLKLLIGGIFSQGTINITSDNPDKNVLFSGNKDSNGSNAIHLDIYNNNPLAGTLNINVSNGAAVIFKDNLSGAENTVANIKGTSSTNDKIYFGSGNENFRSNEILKISALSFITKVQECRMRLLMRKTPILTL